MPHHHSPMSAATHRPCLFSRPSQRILRFLSCSGICFLGIAGAAQTVFEDNLEGGASNWSVYSYPGAPVCTPLTYASTATDPNANHTPGGSFAFKMTRASDRVVHDLDLSLYGAVGLHLALWYYDAMNMSSGDFEAFDLRSPNNSQILGFATRAYADRPDFYWCRALTVTGDDPTGGTGYRPTSIRRTLGWHHLEILQYRDLEHMNTAEFYVDGVLALRQTDVVDTELNRIVLGLGWSGNPSQTGYADDITVQIVPEPCVLSLALAGALTAAALRRVGRTSGGCLAT
jgi:hypothetical protein